MNDKRTLANTVMSFTLQIVTIISGFIVPRLILSTFGSEVNGLVSSLNQFLNYINLFEGGLSAVILASLYKPTKQNDYQKVSSILVASIRFYRKLAVLFLIYTLILGALYPLITNSSFSFSYIFSLVLILSINMFTQYCFSITFRTFLKADRKVYLVSGVQILIIVLNTLGVALMINLVPNIHIVKLVTMLVYLLQPIIFNFYVNRHYPLDLNVEPDQNALNQRWSGFGINLAAFIHNNTDMVVLTIFSNLKSVSIYSVYYLVTSGLKSLITSISAGVVPSIGQLYASNDKNKLNHAFNQYEFVIFYFTFLFFTVGGLLITPFVLIYTNGITDTNYYQPIFGIIMILSEAVFCLREPYVNMAYAAGRFSDISPYAYIEALLNIVLSVILVNQYGLIGVSFSTLVSMLFRTIYHVLYLRKHVLFRSVKIVLKKLIFFSTGCIIIVFISTSLFSFTNISIINWILYGIQNTVLAIIVYTVLSFVLFKNEMTIFLKPLKKFFKREK